MRGEWRRVEERRGGSLAQGWALRKILRQQNVQDNGMEYQARRQGPLCNPREQAVSRRGTHGRRSAGARPTSRACGLGLERSASKELPLWASTAEQALGEEGATGGH